MGKRKFEDSEYDKRHEANLQVFAENAAIRVRKQKPMPSITELRNQATQPSKLTPKEEAKDIKTLSTIINP